MRWKGLKRTAAYGDRWHSMLMTLMPPVCDLVTVIITGPPNGPVLFCSWASVVVVCTAAGGRAGRRRARGLSARRPPGSWAVGRPTLHGGPVRLRMKKEWGQADVFPTVLLHCCLDDAHPQRLSDSRISRERKSSPGWNRLSETYLEKNELSPSRWHSLDGSTGRRGVSKWVFRQRLKVSVIVTQRSRASRGWWSQLRWKIVTM